MIDKSSKHGQTRMKPYSVMDNLDHFIIVKSQSCASFFVGVFKNSLPNMSGYPAQQTLIQSITNG